MLYDKILSYTVLVKTIGVSRVLQTFGVSFLSPLKIKTAGHGHQNV